VTLGTILDAPDLDFLLESECRLFKGDGEVVAKVSASLWTASGGCGRAAEKGIKDIAEATEDIEALKAFAKAITNMSETVVGFPPLGVGEHLVGLINLLEPLSGLILPVVVGVVLEGKLTEGPLYLLIRGRSRYTQNFIIVSFYSHISNSKAEG
jgi:hypothetical protein